MSDKFSISNLWNSRKFKIIVFAVNVCAIILLIGIIVYLHKENQTTSTALDEVNIDEKLNDSMCDVYMSLLKGHTFNVGEGVAFQFDENGSFSGFFDSENRNVSGYHYIVSTDDGINYRLNIYNEDESSTL